MTADLWWKQGLGAVPRVVTTPTGLKSPALLEKLVEIMPPGLSGVQLV